MAYCKRGFLSERGIQRILYLQGCDVESDGALCDLPLAAAPRQHSVHSVDALEGVPVRHAQQQGKHQPDVDLPAKHSTPASPSGPQGYAEQQLSL